MPKTSTKRSSDALAEALNQAQLKNYLAALEPAQRKVLKEMRDLIRAAAPSATDSFSYGIPAARLKGKVLVYYAAWKHHASLYPIAASFDREELKGFRTSKGTVQFPYKKALPAELTSWCMPTR